MRTPTEIAEWRAKHLPAIGARPKACDCCRHFDQLIDDLSGYVLRDDGTFTCAKCVPAIEASPIGDCCSRCRLHGGVTSPAVLRRFDESLCARCAPGHWPERAQPVILSRVAHAVEELVRILGQVTYGAPCRGCACAVVTVGANYCPACGARVTA